MDEVRDLLEGEAPGGLGLHHGLETPRLYVPDVGHRRADAGLGRVARFIRWVRRSAKARRVIASRYLVVR